MTLINAIISELGGAAMTVVLSGLGLVFAYFMGKGKAKKEEVNETYVKRIEAIKKADNVENKIDNLSDGAAADKLRNTWARD